MPFVGRVALEPVKEAGLFDRGLWRVVEPLVFRSERHKVVISVAVDFETDLASVPRWLPISWMLTGGTNVKGSVVHDWIYKHPVYLNGERKMLPRAICDDILDEIGEEDHVPNWRKALVWTGVRVGGWASYNKDAII